jgi:hypothetical protein
MRNSVDELLRFLWPSERPAAPLPARPACGRSPGEPPAPVEGRHDVATPRRDEAWIAVAHTRHRRLRAMPVTGRLAAALVLGWIGGLALHDVLERDRPGLAGTIDLHMVVDRIIRAESSGDPNAKNRQSSAAGGGQFLDGTWLDMVRAHRPDLVRRGEKAALDLRWDAALTREITTRFAERNAAMLNARGLPVTPGTLYLSHFAGSGGAVALLSAPAHLDAASVMAGADASGRTTREKIVKANPFLGNLTVADVKDWSDRKMRRPGARAAEPAKRQVADQRLAAP